MIQRSIKLASFKAELAPWMNIGNQHAAERVVMEIAVATMNEPVTNFSAVNNLKGFIFPVE